MLCLQAMPHNAQEKALILYTRDHAKTDAAHRWLSQLVDDLTRATRALGVPPAHGADAVLTAADRARVESYYLRETAQWALDWLLQHGYVARRLARTDRVYLWARYQEDPSQPRAGRRQWHAALRRIGLDCRRDAHGRWFWDGLAGPENKL